MRWVLLVALAWWLVGCDAGPSSYEVRTLDGELVAEGVSWDQCVIATRDRPDLRCVEG